MSIKKAVLFDLDGTLLDTLDDLTDSTNYILEKYGFPKRDKQEIRSFLGNGAAHLIKSALPDCVDDSIYKECLEDYLVYYREHSQIKTGPYPGIVDLMKKLKNDGVLICVVSNKPDHTVGKLCNSYFGELVDLAVGDRSDIARKPSADPVLFATNKIGCDRSVFVGDSEIDIYTAKNANVPCVSVTWGFRDKTDLVECGGTCFAEDSEELYAVLKSLLDLQITGGSDATC